MEGSSPTDESDSIDQVTFTQLLLLGLDVEDMECVYKIPFNKDMFKGYNKTGANAVLHFLFYILNPTICDEQFRDCWPIVDKKSEAHFRKTCFNWLVSIKKNETDVQWPILNASSLQFPGGPKFIHILFHLSTYVLRQSIPADQDQHLVLINPLVSTSTPRTDAIKLSSIQDNTNIELKNFMRQMYITNSSHQMWNKYASELVHGIRDMSKALRENEQEKRVVVTGLAENAIKQGCTLPVKRTLNMFDGDKDDLNSKRRQRLQRVKSSWDKVNAFYKGLESDRKVVKAVLTPSSSTERLDANDIGIRIPGLLLKQCEKEIRRQQIDNVYIGGCLNLLSVLQLWNLCLHLYLEQLEEAELPDVTKEVPALTMQAHKFHSFLKEIQELREDISSVFIPELEQSIQNLRKEARVDIEDAVPLSQSSLQLTTPTFPSSSLSKSHSNVATPAGLTTPKATKKKDTPTVLSEMVASIANITHKAQAVQPARLTFDKLKTSQRSSPSMVTAPKNMKKTRVGRAQRDTLSASSQQRTVKETSRTSQLSESSASNKSLMIEKEEEIDSYKSILDQMAHSLVDSVIDKHDNFNYKDRSHRFSSVTSSNVDQNNASSFSHALMQELEQEGGCDVNATLEDSFAPLKYGILLDKSPMKAQAKSVESKSPNASLDSSFDMNRMPTLKPSMPGRKPPISPLDSSFTTNPMLKSPLSIAKSPSASLSSLSNMNLMSALESPSFLEKSPAASLDSSFNVEPLSTLISPWSMSKSPSGSLNSSQDLNPGSTMKSPLSLSSIEILKRRHIAELKPNPTPPSSSAWDIQRQVDDLFSQGCKIFEDIDDD